MAMLSTRREPFGIELPSVWRRWLDTNLEPERWLRVEEVHEDGALVIRAEAPGLDPDKDIEVTVTDDVLHIVATRQERSEDEGAGTSRSEFRYGEFSRVIHLPPGVTTEAVSAAYKDGILEVRIPWATPQQAAPTTVPVTRA